MKLADQIAYLTCHGSPPVASVATTHRIHVWSQLSMTLQLSCQTAPDVDHSKHSSSRIPLGRCGAHMLPVPTFGQEGHERLIRQYALCTLWAWCHRTFPKRAKSHRCLLGHCERASVSVSDALVGQRQSSSLSTIDQRPEPGGLGPRLRALASATIMPGEVGSLVCDPVANADVHKLLARKYRQQ